MSRQTKVARRTMRYSMIIGAMLVVLTIPASTMFGSAQPGSQALSSLRVWGQKDLVNGRAHLWIQNKGHTWKNVVDGKAIPPASGDITIMGFKPGQLYTLEWWDTYQSDPAQQILATQSLVGRSDGSLVFGVRDLSADIAVKIFMAEPAAPIVGVFTPDEGSGSVAGWADISTTYSDPNGYEDITWAFFFLDRAGMSAAGGLAAAYYQPDGLIMLLNGPGCYPGENKFLVSPYLILDCQASGVISESSTLTVTWRIGPLRCFEGGCGENMAFGFVRDSYGLSDSAVMGVWTLDERLWPVYPFGIP